MNSTPDLITAIVTNYNHAKYLDQRMESLLNQTYKNLEIVVIDNCSTDNSLEVLEKYKKYNHVKIVALEKNGGFVNSCNLGVSLARGKFFIFAEADDFNAPTQLELLHQAMAGNEQIGVAYCRSSLVDAQGKVFDEDFNHRMMSFREFCSKDTFIPRHLMQRFFLFDCVIVNFSAVLMRRKIYQNAGGLTTHYKGCPDWDLWFHIVKDCDFYYLSSPLNSYRRHEGSYQSILGIQSLIMDIMEVLYKAFRQSDLNFWEGLQFRVNFGFLWGRYFRNSPLIWLKSFPSIWWRSLKYDKLSIVYLVLAVIKRGQPTHLRKSLIWGW